MFSCDYNGWADVPEEEREAFDALEVEKTAQVVLVYLRPLIKPLLPSTNESSRRYAA